MSILGGPVKDGKKQEEKKKKTENKDKLLQNTRKNPYHRKHGDEAEKKRIMSMSHLSDKQKKQMIKNIDAGTPGKSKSKSKGKSKGKTLTKAQIRFKEREAKGLSGLTGGKKGETIAEYRARKKKQVQDAARERNKKWKEERKYKKTGTAKKVGKMFKRTGVLAEDKGKKQGSKKKVGNMFKRTGLFK